MNNYFIKLSALGVTSLFGLSVAHGDVLLTDNFHVTSNSQNVNQEIAGRQAGPLAPALYSGWQNTHQVGNTTTDVGQPGGVANSDYVLLAGNGAFFSSLNIASIATGPLTIEFDMYRTGTRNGGDATDWGACVLKEGGDCFPVISTSDSFGFLARANGGIQVFQNNGNIAPGSWDAAGFATDPHFKLIFSDTAGTGSAFNGAGSKVTFVNGTTELGTITLGQLKSKGLRLGFRDGGHQYIGIANLSLSGTPAPLPPARNLSFEQDQELPGKSVNLIPTYWTGFGVIGVDRMGSQNAGGGDYSTFSPLAAPADGSQFFWINRFGGDGVGGIYQDMGALQANTIYTLTVSIGSRKDRINSPGIISLINGTDNSGTVMATATALQSAQDTWQDYSVSFTNAALTGHLTIVLSVNGASSIQANFDNVRLTTADAPAVIAPTLLTDVKPLLSRVTTGTPLSLAVTASGSTLSYQWFNQNGPISGATSPGYSFNAVSGTSSYYVSVSNSANVVTSSTAVVVSAANIVTVNNYSFENGSTPAFGNGAVPLAWTSFNGDWAGMGTGPAFPAQDGVMYFAVNTSPGHNGASGIYQDVGALLPNTTYTLTVAIGRSSSAGVPPNGVGDWSPGIISLLGGTDNTGTLLATTTGYPDTMGTWQNYAATFTTGTSVSGHLVITLSDAPANTYQCTFDNVSLTMEPYTVPVAPTITAPVILNGNLIVTGTGGTPNRTYTVQTTTSLSTPVTWTTQTTGSLTGAGAISASIPVDNTKSACFFRVLMQ